MSRWIEPFSEAAKRVGVGRVLRVIGVEGVGADVAVGRIREREEAAVAQLDLLALLVLHDAELDVGVVQLAEHLAGRFRPSRLCIANSRSSLSLKRVRLEAQDARQQELVGGQRRGLARSSSIFAAGMARISGRMKLDAWPCGWRLA